MLLSKNVKGFTLIELLIAMALALALMTGIYTTYRSQQKAYLVQDQVAAMQQQLRAAMYAIESDLRMAGFDPHRTGGKGISAATNNTITFTFDEEYDGEDDDSDGMIDEADELVRETITYNLFDAFISSGENDGITDDLERTEGGNSQPLASNIQTIDFVYLDGNGNPLGTDSNGDGLVDTLTNAQLNNIRSVEVTLVAKTNDLAEGIWVDNDYTNSNAYINAWGQTILNAQNDNLRRMSLTKRIRCRNLDL